jgi:hypothetical protein
MRRSEDAVRKSRKTEPEALIALLQGLYGAERAALELTALGRPAISQISRECRDAA